MEIAHHSNAMKVIPPQMMKDAHAIVIILRFAGSGGQDRAREASEQRGGIPILRCRTWNYLIPEVLACDKLYMWHHSVKDNGHVKPEPKKAEPPPEPPLDMGISERQCWNDFGDSLVRVVGCIFRPGEKMVVDEFIDDLAAEVGLSVSDTKRMLKHLALAGILDNPVGDTWRYIGEGAFTLDLEPAPKHEKITEPQRARIVNLLRGLKPGPWPSRYAIENEAATYEEFTTRGGKPLSRMMLYHYVRAALEEGVIKAQGNGFVIAGHDPKVKLTLRSNAEEIRKKHGTPKTKSKSKARPEATAPPLKKSDSVQLLREIVGNVEPASIIGVDPDHIWDVIHAVKREIPIAHWDRLAQNTCATILRKKGVEPKPIPKELFDNGDWDALAWETLKTFKIEAVAPYFKFAFFDEDAKCADCESPFTFTKAEKGFYYDKELSAPKRCPKCRRKP